jgi:hypothetical protein
MINTRQSVVFIKASITQEIKTRPSSLVTSYDNFLENDMVKF